MLHFHSRRLEFDQHTVTVISGVNANGFKP